MADDEIELQLLKGRKSQKGGEADEGDDVEMPAGEEVAQEFIDAVKAGDAAAVWKAYRGLAACDSNSSDDE